MRLWFKLKPSARSSARDIFRQNPVPDTEMSARRPLPQAHHRPLRAGRLALQGRRTSPKRIHLEFRDKLIPASDFQSRADPPEIEVLLGLEDGMRTSPSARRRASSKPSRAPAAPRLPPSPACRKRLADRPAPSKEALYEWLTRTPIYGGEHSEEGTVHLPPRLPRPYKKDAEDRMSRAMTAAGSAVDADEIRARYEREMKNAEAFLFAEEDPTATPEQKRRRRARSAPPLSSWRLPRGSPPRLGPARSSTASLRWNRP
ncbi:MAG: hypothetical protein R3B70_13005 [Polyangiaceae bacterium]